MIFIDSTKFIPSTFPDGTLAIKLKTIRPLDAKHVCITWLYDNDSEMAQLFYITNHLKELGCIITLRLPYIPNARMDRVKNPDEIFTLKYFAKFINSLNFYEVRVLDPHSSVATALLDRVVIEPVNSWITMVADHIENRDVVFCFPDEGAMKRYSESFTPFCFGIKQRDWSTGEIQSLKLENEEIVKDKDILIIDDICSKGTTFLNTAKALREAGAKNVYLYVTHCENNIFNGELLETDYIDKIFTTCSIIRKSHPKITIVDSISRPLRP